MTVREPKAVPITASEMRRLAIDAIDRFGPDAVFVVRESLRGDVYRTVHRDRVAFITPPPEPDE